MRSTGPTPNVGLLGTHIRNGPVSGLKIGGKVYRRFVPNSGCEQLQQKRPLFNHLVGTGEHSIWQGNTRRLCGF